jgi:hypothetical protein
MNSKYQKIQFYKVTQYFHKKMIIKITPEPFVFCLHHGIQFLTSNLIISWEMTLKNVYPTFLDLQKTIIININILHECKESRN